MRRLPNGDLTWYQSRAGGRITVSKEQTEQYSPAAATEGAQVEAERANAEAEDAYMNSLEQAQASVDASRPIPAVPVKPLYTTVTDPVMDRKGQVVEGKEVKTPWPAPGLPDLQPKMVWKSGASAPVAEPIVVSG